jgi:hypothetical protein
MSPTIHSDANQPDPHQGHTRQWPSTPYSDEARAAHMKDGWYVSNTIFVRKHRVR